MKSVRVLIFTPLRAPALRRARRAYLLRLVRSVWCVTHRLTQSVTLSNVHCVSESSPLSTYTNNPALQHLSALSTPPVPLTQHLPVARVSAAPAPLARLTCSPARLNGRASLHATPSPRPTPYPRARPESGLNARLLVLRSVMLGWRFTRPHGPSEQAGVVPGSQRRPDNRAWAIGSASGGWLKLILLRVPQESPSI